MAQRTARAPRRLTVLKVSEMAGRIVLDHLMADAGKRPKAEAQACDTVLSWIVAAYDPATLRAMGEALPLDIFAWKAMRKETMPGGEPRPLTGRSPGNEEIPDSEIPF